MSDWEIDPDPVAEALKGAYRQMVSDPRDWGSNATDARLYAVLCGWGSNDEVWQEMAVRHGWEPDFTAALKRRREAVAVLQGEEP